MEAAFPGNNCKIAFSCYDGHHQEINTINAGSGGRSRVTNNVDDIWRLFWRAGSGLTAILPRSSTVDEIGSPEPVRNVVWALFFTLG